MPSRLILHCLCCCRWCKMEGISKEMCVALSSSPSLARLCHYSPLHKIEGTSIKIETVRHLYPRKNFSLIRRYCDLARSESKRILDHWRSLFWPPKQPAVEQRSLEICGAMDICATFFGFVRVHHMLVSQIPKVFSREGQGYIFHEPKGFVMHGHPEISFHQPSVTMKYLSKA